ncbi:hypothetical protein [Sediminihaliea albiluteola]|uniref:hypothetical protein n=1 Tax=Sediminihaliea albiluteola TaxID=2758564 RepID=UPI002E28B15C|nr:hypothetical protein [Sediminihaliea albiluteola]
MKKPISKAELRAALEDAMLRYLDKGGEVETVPRGVSGADPLSPSAHRSRNLFLEPRTERTPVPEVVAAIEARRQAMLKRNSKAKAPAKTPKPRRKTLYDDFGEPLRRVWSDD